MGLDAVQYEFAGFRLDPASRQLLGHDGATIDLPARAMDALLLFVERPGILRDRRSLVRTLWQDTYVEENSLDQLVSQLRRLLAASSKSALIVTERGRGFRFVAAVRRSVDAAPAGSDTARALYEQACSLVNRPSPSNLEGAFGLLTTALECDPGLAPALAERALVRALFMVFDLPMEGALDSAEAEAQLALQLDPRLARAHQALAYICVARRRWLLARRHFDQACELEQVPGASISRVWQISLSVGHLQLALDQAQEAHERAPLMPLSSIAMAMAASSAGRHDEAIAHADRAALLGWPRAARPLPDIHFLHALQQGRHAAIADCIRHCLAPQMLASGATRLADQIAAALAHPAERPAAATALHALVVELGAARLGQLNLKRMMLWFTLLAARDAAFDSCDRLLHCYAPTDSIGTAWDLLWLPQMAEFRRDRRFRPLLERLDFQSYWDMYGPPDDMAMATSSASQPATSSRAPPMDPATPAPR
jgi:DNA-binding winged helix-turn-helix (wHTH) protein